MNRRALKKHLGYIVPEMRLALIKELGMKPQAIGGCPVVTYQVHKQRGTWADLNDFPI